MVYNWDDKRDICFRMYIEEKRALEDIMEHLKVNYQFAPSKRAFQTQFKRWGFPSKQNPAHKNAPLVARIKELWEHNVNQREMLRVLHAEGFDIKEREVVRVRSRNRWLLREPNGTRSQGHVNKAEVGVLNNSSSIKEVGSREHDPLLALQGESICGQTHSLPSSLPASMSRETRATALGDVQAGEQLHTQSLGAYLDFTAQHHQRPQRLQTDSSERWSARKRRRRAKSWGTSPAETPVFSRFPSEITIDESKRYLNLTNDMYHEVRGRFQNICEEYGFLKKTAAGPEKWQAAKNRLIAEIPHLQSLLWSSPSPSNADVKYLALDVVCTDVTKRMRTMQRRMTIVEAKNELGINPEQSRQLRSAFRELLEVSRFANKYEAGDGRWAEIKTRLIQSSPILQNILAPGVSDPNSSIKLRAIEVLCRDVLKRFRDDQTRRALPGRKSSSSSQPESDRAQHAADKHDGASPLQISQEAYATQLRNGISTLASQALASAPVSDLQIDPTLLEAAACDANVAANEQIHPVSEEPLACESDSAVGSTSETASEHRALNQQIQSAKGLRKTSITSGAPPIVSLSPSQAPNSLHIGHADSSIDLSYCSSSTLATFYIDRDFASGGQWTDSLPGETVADLHTTINSYLQGRGLVSAEHSHQSHLQLHSIKGIWFDSSEAKVTTNINDDHDLKSYLRSLSGGSAIFEIVLNTQ
ncbi:hypothetical protein KEM54_003301 [Ascosphaera aggregata]|nr:hypothetical protein KEM54_003301 [Ascosphaera aggregata]